MIMVLVLYLLVVQLMRFWVFSYFGKKLISQVEYYLLNEVLSGGDGWHSIVVVLMA